MKITRILKGAGIRSSYGSMGAGSVTLIETNKKVLIDTGHFGNRDALLNKMQKLKVKPSSIDIVVLTHINWDHCLNVDLFPYAKIVLGSDEFERGTLSGVPDDLTQHYKEYLTRRELVLAGDGFQVDKNVYVVSTPGHTPGHIAIAARDKNGLALITGDCIPNIRSYRRGVPDIVFFNLETAKKSIQKVKRMKPDIIYPGHDAPFDNTGYLEHDLVDILLREEQEENTRVTIGKESADMTVIFNE